MHVYVTSATRYNNQQTVVTHQQWRGRKRYKVGDQLFIHNTGSQPSKIEDKSSRENQEYLVLELAMATDTDGPCASLKRSASANSSARIRSKRCEGAAQGQVTDGRDNWSRRFKANSEKLRSGESKWSPRRPQPQHPRTPEGLSTGERRMRTGLARSCPARSPWPLSSKLKRPKTYLRRP